MRGMYETVGGQIEPPIPRSPLHRSRSPLHRSVTSFRRDSVPRCFRSPVHRSVTSFRRDSLLRCVAALIQKNNKAIKVALLFINTPSPTTPS